MLVGNIPSRQEPSEWEGTYKLQGCWTVGWPIWVPDSNILRPDKVLHPVAVETLFGDEKFKPTCTHVERHIAIGWPLMFFVGVQKAWPKPHNLHISGRVIDICGIPIQIWVMLNTSLTLHESFLALFSNRPQNLWPADRITLGYFPTCISLLHWPV